MGQQVGNGECWTLAFDALNAVASSCRSAGQEPCMSSQGVVHGSLIYSNLPSSSDPSSRVVNPPGGVIAAGVARGDIVQYLSAHFKRPNGCQSWAGAPDHTAVITGVDRDGALSIVQQNVGGVKRVSEGTCDISELVGGEIRVFRAVGESWAGVLDTKWQ